MNETFVIAPDPEELRREAVKEAHAERIRSMADWEWWVMLSTTFPTSADALNAQVASYRERLVREVGRTFACTWVVEPGEEFGRLHAHVLLGREASLTPTMIRCAWKAGETKKVKSYFGGGAIEGYMVQSYFDEQFRMDWWCKKVRLTFRPRGKRGGRRRTGETTQP